MGKHLGFTGTRHKLNLHQEKKLLDTLKMAQDFGYTDLHHGDCVGADKLAHEIGISLGYGIIIHPPTDSKLRAWCESADLVLPEKSYLERNKDIVNFSEILIACPNQTQEVLRSGTWSTIRYARLQRKPVEIIWP